MMPHQNEPQASEAGPNKVPISETWQFRLYVAGNAPHSLLAITNLKILADKLLSGNYTVEVIDILKEPLRTLEDGVYVTPTLIRLSPEPICRIIGNLSDQKPVLAALGLLEAPHE